MSQSTIKLILGTMLLLGLLSSLTSCGTSTECTTDEQCITCDVSHDTTNTLYYTAVEQLDYSRVVRVIHTPRIASISNVLYDDNETVWVNKLFSTICNNHLDSHTNCSRFDIIQALQ